MFLGGGLTATALLVNSGMHGCDFNSNEQITQGVHILPGSAERLESAEVKRGELGCAAPESPRTLSAGEVREFYRESEHQAGLGPGYGPARWDGDPPPADVDLNAEPLVGGKYRW
jgi:hypothetical protein